MKYRKLRNSGLEVSVVGLGCMGLSHAYGAAVEKKEATRLIRSAYEMGYTFFDTAECYLGTNPDGTISCNEEIIGEAIQPIRDKVVIATKFGVHLEHGTTGAPIPDSRPETIRQSVEGSLKRLKIECIDLYYQHRTDPGIPVEEVAGVMTELIDSGKIKHWGLSEVDEATLRRAHAVCPVTAIQNRYSMMFRDNESLFPTLEELGITFVAFSPMANGFLTGSYDKGSKFVDGDYRNFMPQFSEEAHEKNQVLLSLLNGIAESKNATMAQISLAWMICKKPWLVPIPGTRKITRLKENAEAADVLLSADEVKALDEALDGIEISDVFGGTSR